MKVNSDLEFALGDVNISIDAIVFRTFRKLGADDADATAFAEELNSAIDKRYELHAGQLATKGDLDVAKLEIIRDLSRQMLDMQRWSLGVTFAGIAAVAAIVKLLG